MATLLATITAAIYGTADFLGGMATKRAPVLRVMLWVHAVGLLVAVLVAPFIADRIIASDLVYGIAAGVTGLLGMTLLYWALATGPMSVVAPVSGLVTAVVPVTWSLAFDGHDLSAVVAAGIALGLVAVVTTSWEPRSRYSKPSDTSSTSTGRATHLLAAVAAGTFFGSLVLLYDKTDEAGAPWPVVAGRAVTVVILLLVALALRRPLSPGPALVPAAAAGAFDTLANVTLLLAALRASDGDELAVVAVITAFYPAATVIWARIVLRERLGPTRVAGLALALVAIAMMTLG